MLVRLKPEYTCKPLSPNKFGENQISKSWTNTPRYFDWELNCACMTTELFGPENEQHVKAKQKEKKKIK